MQIIKVSPDRDNQYYVEILGVRYNITNKLKDGKYTLTILGEDYACEAKAPKKSNRNDSNKSKA